MALTEDHGDHATAAAIDDDPLDATDVAVLCVHARTVGYLVLTWQLIRDGVDGHDLRDLLGVAWRVRLPRLHSSRGNILRPRDHGFPAVDLVVLIARKEIRRLGGSQLAELRHCAAEPDLALGGIGSPGVDKVERDQLAQSLPVRRLDDEVGDRVIAWVNDQALDLAAVPVGTANVSPQPEQLRLSHACPPALSSPASAYLSMHPADSPVTWPGSLHRQPGSGRSCSRMRLRRGRAPAL